MTTPDERFDALERRLAMLGGEVAVLGMALQAVLKHHPSTSAVADTLHTSYEEAMSRMLQLPFPEDFLTGMTRARDLYLLTRPTDPSDRT